MNFAYSDDQKALAELARKILADKATHERIGAIEKSESGFDRELWASSPKANLLGACLPEEFGGSGLGMLELCLAARGDRPRGRAGALLARRSRSARCRSRSSARAAQKAAWLPGVIAGEIVPHRARSRRPTATTRCARPRAPCATAPAGASPARRSACPRRTSPSACSCPRASAAGRVGLFLVDPKGARREARDAARDQPRAGRDAQARAREGEGRPTCSARSRAAAR